jgi:hypothetical protein
VLPCKCLGAARSTGSIGTADPSWVPCTGEYRPRSVAASWVVHIQMGTNV